MGVGVNFLPRKCRDKKRASQDVMSQIRVARVGVRCRKERDKDEK